MIKELHKENWDYSVYRLEGKLIVTIVFFAQIDYFRSFYLNPDEVTKDYQLVDNLADKIRTNYEDFKDREITPPISKESGEDSDRYTLSPRECFYVKSASSYFYNKEHPFSNDLRENIKTLISIYSAGENLSNVDDFLDLILNKEYKETNWDLKKLSDYYLAISLLSFIHVRRSNTPVKNIQKLVPFDEDRLMSFIVMDSLELDYGKTILNINPYIYLHNYIVNRNQSSKNLDSFFVNFYGAFKGNTWHDSHIKDKKAFFGYWAISVAAIVQKLNLDDHFFMDQMFYPRDLIGRQLLPTWEDSPRGIWARDLKEKIVEKIHKKKQQISKEELEKLIIAEFEDVLNKHQKVVFSASFQKKVKRIEKKAKKLSESESAEAFKGFVREFAEDIISEPALKKPFFEFMNDKELMSQIQSALAESIDISDIDLENELAEFIDKQGHKKISQEQLQNYQELGHKLVELDKKYPSPDNELYWDQLDELLKPFQTTKTDPMIDIKNSIAASLNKKLNAKGKSIDFNVSIDDIFKS